MLMKTKKIRKVKLGFYPYTYVRTNVMRTLLLNKDDYAKLFKMSFIEITRYLQDSVYKKDQVCQMHYFRFMRTGTYDKRKPKYRVVNPAGYQSIYEPEHETSDNRGYSFEHRFVLFNKSGHSLKVCSICKKPWSWSGGRSSHVDHIDEDVTNNHVSNLRTLCNACNTRRGRKPEHEYEHIKAVEYNGEVKSIKEWSNQDFVPVEHFTIRRRLISGWSVHDALTMPARSGKAYQIKRSKDLQI